MKSLLILAGIVAVNAHFHPVNEHIIKEIKSKATTWVPMELEENPLHHMTIDQVKGLLGTIVDHTDTTFPNASVPNGYTASASFDARSKWGSCVHAVRDQASCGSCWAFGASEALSDRFCIKKGQNVVLSPQDMVSCDKSNMGCNGGYLSNAWAYLTNTGVVTDACYPYTSGKAGVTGTCAGKCTGSGSWTKYKCAAGTTVVARTTAAIQNEIENNGPMETAFNVYSDFMNYKSGVYQHKSGVLEGGHAIKILGWGTASGLNYWLCANSWGTSWGESGFFRIAYGECGIDSSIYACTPGTVGMEEELIQA